MKGRRGRPGQACTGLPKPSGGEIGKSVHSLNRVELI